MMLCEVRVAAMEFDKNHRKPGMGVEYLFNQQVTKFPHIDDYWRHIKTQKWSVKLELFALFMGSPNTIL